MYNRGVSLARAVDWNTNERFVCRALSFGNLFFLLWIDFFYAKSQCLSSLNNRGVSLSRAVVWNTNERDVCTSREFWQFIFLVLDGIYFLPKLREKLDVQSRSVPVLCVLKNVYCIFCAFLTFSFGYVKIVLWKYCLLM